MSIKDFSKAFLDNLSLSAFHSPRGRKILIYTSIMLSHAKDYLTR